MCFFLCSNTPLYNYEASGSQKEIMTPIIKKFAEQGYELRNTSDPESDGSGVLCYGGAGDRYSFEKVAPEDPSKWNSWQVTFYAEKNLGDVSTSEVGCQRPDAKYRVEILDFDKLR
jgi:hypothetical protein